MLHGQYSNSIELEEVELSPDNLVFMLKSIQELAQPENVSKFSHVVYREILSAGSHSVLTTDRNLIYQLDVEHPLNYSDAFESNWWLTDEKCSFSGRYKGPFPDLSFAARTFQLCYFIKLLEDYFDRLIVSKGPDKLGLSYHFRADSNISPMKISGSLLFNHESPRRGETFVTRKITNFLARLIKGSKEILYLGNIYAERDWGHAMDYVEMQWRMLQNKKPKDYVIATGQTTSVKKFINECLTLLEKHEADVTNSFRNLNNPHQLKRSLTDDDVFVQWNNKRINLIGKENIHNSQKLMDSVNPYVIPRNHLVEQSLDDANNGNLETFYELLQVIQHPYSIPENQKYLEPPSLEYEQSYRTFCGT